MALLVELVAEHRRSGYIVNIILPRRISITCLCEHLFRQFPPFSIVKVTVEAQNASATLETVASHLEFVHGVHILNMHLDRRPVRSFGRPHIEILMPSGLKVQSVVTIMEVSELRQEMKMRLGVQLCVW
jgi:hypothetical protein